MTKDISPELFIYNVEFLLRQ